MATLYGTVNLIAEEKAAHFFQNAASRSAAKTE